MTKWRAFLQGVFGNEAVKKAVIWLVVVVVGIAVVLTQFLFPVHPSYRYAKIYRYSDDSFTLNVSGLYDKIKNGDSENGVLLSDTVFDMSQQSAYLRIELVFDFTNIGMYKLSDIQFAIDAIGSFKERFVLKEGNMAEINRFSNGAVSLYVIINIKDMTDEQINEAINSMTVSYSYNRPELFPSGGNIELPKISLPLNDIIEK